MALANSLALALLAAVCSSSAPRLVPLALLLLADRCEAAGTVCDNSVPCSSGCPTSVYGTSLCDGTFTGTEVYLYNLGLSGTIPPQLGDISQLTYLRLFGSSISGTIPAEMGKLSQLQTLDLGSNSISGTIPPDMSKLSKLAFLSLLLSNSISGTIPPETSKLSQLKWLYLYNNSISGTIPPDMSKLSRLKSLYLYDNDISGTVPSQLNNLPLTSCGLGGTNHFACPLPALPAVCTSAFLPKCNYPPPSPPSFSPPLAPLPPSAPPHPPGKALPPDLSIVNGDAARPNKTNLFVHQFPPLCHGRFLAVTDDLVGAGLGFTAILLARLLAVAVRERRILVEVPSSQPRWCTAPPQTLGCYYQPWTNCSLEAHAADVRSVSLKVYHQSRKWYSRRTQFTPHPIQFLFRANALVRRHADAVAAGCGGGGYWTVHVRDSPEKKAELHKKRMPGFEAYMRHLPPSATRVLWQTASPAAFADMFAYAAAHPTMRFCATNFSRHDEDVWGGRNASLVDESGLTGAVNGELGRRGEGLVSLKSSMWTFFLSALHPSMRVVAV